MNTAHLKDFAPAARTMLLEAVKNRALKVGVTATRVEPLTVEGDFVSIGGIRYPRRIADLRTKLLAKISREGFDAVMEEAAYTWFNRLVAIRYMEVRGYLKHGYRVLSDPTGAVTPEILAQAQNVDIVGLDKRRVLEFLADGSKQEELYQLLLLAQCHELSDSLPFLFDRIDGANELLTPDGLLASDSIVRKIVKDIPEGGWQTTEILGWLYQFYVSDKKAKVDAYVKNGRAVEPEDIPAKTQLFTPNWIVQFMVQNSLGRLWMDVYSTSELASKMPYYCPPAQQKPEVEQQLQLITPRELDPTKLTAIDPAAGSGHILLELYNLFFEMYREQGYLPTEIPRQIVEKNLFGLELDRRAAQIAGFAVLMRARRDDPRLLENPPKVNVLPIRHSRNLDLHILLGDTASEPIVPSENLFEDAAIQPRLTSIGRPLMSDPKLIRELCRLFNDADIEGSLIRVPRDVQGKLDTLTEEIGDKKIQSGLYAEQALNDLQHLVFQAKILGSQYSSCVANPPYLGGKAMVKELKDFAKDWYPNTKADLFAMFLERGFDFAEPNGFNAMVTMQSWMFLPKYEKFRKGIIENQSICSMVHMGNGVMGIAFGTAATSIRNSRSPSFVGSYSYTETKDLGETNRPVSFPVPGPRCGTMAQSQFKKIPGWPIAYWASQTELSLFESTPSVKSLIVTREGLTTGSNTRFLRLWHEVAVSKIGFGLDSVSESIASRKRWFPYQKGGDYRRWFGNNQHVVNWFDDGIELKAFVDIPTGRVRSHNYNGAFAFRPGLTWSAISSGLPAFRIVPKGFKFDTKGPMGFGDKATVLHLIGFLNSTVATALLKMLAPTLDFKLGRVEALPAVVDRFDDGHSQIVEELCQLHALDWDSLETSVDFMRPRNFPSDSTSAWWTECRLNGKRLVERTAHLERRNNEYALLATQLEGTVSPDVRPAEISLWANPLHVFRPKRKDASDEEEDALEYEQPAETLDQWDGDLLEDKFRRRGVTELVNYALGCMMGRYSLDEPGLIYADEGNKGFDAARYKAFDADSDGILPLTDEPYFAEDDTANRFEKWVQTVWSNSLLDGNLRFIAECLGMKLNETPLEAIRRYLAEDFYKDHLQAYKKRPIYWLFTSGKTRAFQALVYLHRYNSATLSRMRSDYVGPLIRMLQAQLDEAKKAEDKATSGSQKTAAGKLFKKLKEQLDELLDFDKRLHHYALEQIELDLDDGVKVNYGKFSDPKVGDILAKVKDITGGKDD